MPAPVGLDFSEVWLDSYAGLGGCDGGVDEEEAETGSEDLNDFAGLVLEDCPVASVAVEADDGGSRFWEHRAFGVIACLGMDCLAGSWKGRLPFPRIVF